MLQTLPFFNELQSYPVIFFLAIVVSTFCLEDVATIMTSVMMADGTISFSFGFSALALGIFLGDFGLYLIGVGIRRGLFKRKPPKYRPSIAGLIIARFIPGMRTFTYTAAGVANIHWRPFVLAIMPSAVIWTWLLVVSTKAVMKYLEMLPLWGWWVVAAFMIVIIHLLEKTIRKKLEAKSDAESGASLT